MDVSLHDLVTRLEEMAARLERIERHVSPGSLNVAEAPAQPVPDMGPVASSAPVETREAGSNHRADTTA